MGFLNLFNKKKAVLTEAQLKWNKMWELWSDGKIESPYAELMTYQSEINNGGHSQYFSNAEENGILQNELAVLAQILPPVLNDNLQKAYNAYISSEEISEKYDAVFYENEQEIIRILEKHAEKTEI